MSNSILKHMLLTFRNGLTPLHHAIVNNSYADVERLLRQGESIGVLSEMLSQKMSKEDEGSAHHLDRLFISGNAALDYILDTGDPVSWNCLIEKSQPKVIRKLLETKSLDGGSILHSDKLLVGQNIRNILWTLFDQAADPAYKPLVCALLLTRNNQGKNFIAKHLALLSAMGVSVAELLNGINGIDSNVAIELLRQVDNSGDNLVSQIFVECEAAEIQLIVEAGKFGDTFTEMLVKPNHSGETAAHALANIPVDENHSHVLERQQLLMSLLGQKHYTELLITPDNYGGYPLIEILRKERNILAAGGVAHVDFFLKFMPSLDSITLEKVALIKDSFGFSVFHFFDYFPDSLCGLLGKLKLETRKKVLFEISFSGVSVISLIAKSLRSRHIVLSHDILEDIGCREAINCFKYESVEDRCSIFRVAPELFPALFPTVDTDYFKRDEFLVHLILSGVLFKAFMHSPEKYLDPILGYFSVEELNKLIYAYLSAQDRADSDLFNEESLKYLIEHFGDDGLKALLQSFGDVGYKFMSAVSKLCPSEFKRLYESLTEEKQNEFLKLGGQDFFVGALDNRNHELVRFLIQKGYKPEVYHLAKSIYEECWAAFHLISQKITPSELIELFAKDKFGIKELLESEVATTSFNLYMAQFIRLGPVADIENPSLTQKVLIHISRYFNEFRKDRNLSVVVNKKTVSFFVNYCGDEKLPWMLDEEEQLKLYNDIHERAYGADNYLKETIYSQKIEMFLMNFLCRVATSGLSKFRAVEGAAVFKETVETRQKVVLFRHAVRIKAPGPAPDVLVREEAQPDTRLAVPRNTSERT